MSTSVIRASISTHYKKSQALSCDRLRLMSGQCQSPDRIQSGARSSSLCTERTSKPTLAFHNHAARRNREVAQRIFGRIGTSQLQYHEINSIGRWLEGVREGLRGGKYKASEFIRFMVVSTMSSGKGKQKLKARVEQNQGTFGPAEFSRNLALPELGAGFFLGRKIPESGEEGTPPDFSFLGLSGTGPMIHGFGATEIVASRRCVRATKEWRRES